MSETMTSHDRSVALEKIIVSMIVELLEDEATPEMALIDAVRLLGHIKHVNVKEILMDTVTMKGWGPHIRVAAAKALLEQGKP